MRRVGTPTPATSPPRRWLTSRRSRSSCPSPTGEPPSSSTPPARRSAPTSPLETRPVSGGKGLFDGEHACPQCLPGRLADLDEPRVRPRFVFPTRLRQVDLEGVGHGAGSRAEDQHAIG